MTRRQRVQAIGVLVLVLTVLVVSHTGTWRGVFHSQKRLYELLGKRSGWTPLIIVVLQMAQVLLAPVPGQIVGMASGHLLGMLAGTFYSTLGLAIGSWLALWLARRFGRPLVQALVTASRLEQLDRFFEHRGATFFLLVFLLPFLPDDLACFAAGLTSIPLPLLLVVAVVGRVPGILVSAWIGATARNGMNPEQWIAVGGVSAAVAWFFARHQAAIENTAVRAAEQLDRLLSKR